LSLPESIASATLLRDTLTVTINNDFNFDPLRPSATARGYLVIRVASGSAAIGRDSVDGSTTGLPTGGSLTRRIPLSGTVSGADGIQISTTLDSPLGDPVRIDETRTISVSGSTGPLYVSSAGVRLSNQAVTSSATHLDLTDVDKTITDHLESGEVLLDINNPFAVNGTLTVTLATSVTTIVKTAPLVAGASTQRIALSGDELRSLFGADVQISISGTVNGSNVTVTPGQTVSVTSRLHILVNTTRTTRTGPK
jgi:hypothetical protein